ncbi:MAG: hypothetical protein Q7S92_03035 [Candidatus Diapherotrites archaeon]|nr:hypothetical protein [Candidatus Diapherotrites archaeon]
MKSARFSIRKLVVLTEKTKRKIKALTKPRSVGTRFSFRGPWARFLTEIKQLDVLTPSKMAFFASHWVHLPFPVSGVLAAQAVRFHVSRNLLKDFPAKRKLVNQLFSTKKIEQAWLYSFIRKAGSKQAALDACSEVANALRDLAHQAREYAGKKVYHVSSRGERIDFVPHLFGNAVSGPIGFAQMIRDKIQRLQD